MYFEAENLHKNVGSITVDFSFTAQKGSMTAILGPSGSGKSTVLRLIAGLETCSKNNPPPRLILDGKNILNENISKRGIGMVFQSGALFSHLSVEDNIAYGLICRKISKKNARSQAKELLKKMNLLGFEKRRIETLSGGEAQRVSLARTLATKPNLILFDEPLSALDAPLRKKLGQEIKLLQKEEGFTGIFVTHDIQEAKSLCESIVFMKEGKILWQGDSKDFDESMLELF